MNKITRELNDKDTFVLKQNGADRDLEYKTLKENVNTLITNAITASVPLVYTAQITQAGTAAPTVTVLKNTIGNIVWAYSSVGIYTGTLATAFPLASTVSFAQVSSTVATGYTANIGATDANTITINSYSAAGALANSWSGFIEIRVY